MALNPETAREDVLTLSPGAAVVYDEPLKLQELRSDLVFYPVPFDKLIVDVTKDAKLRRLVRNLLENARRHGGGGVRVRVDAGRGGACLRVEDAGPGVPEAERERIFEPFYRSPGSPETGTGHGLGLALVRQIARAHGGEARCLARSGGGSVFEITLG